MGTKQRIMSEEERLRRKELRRRPKMMERARALGFLPDDDDQWTVVVARKGSRKDKKWGDES